MGNKTVKAILCLLIIAAVFAGIGCAGRADDRNGQGNVDKATPTPAPQATNAPPATPIPAPAATLQPGQSTTTPVPSAQPPGNNAGGYTTTLSLDDVFFSGGDAQYNFVEDALPTPPAE